MGDQGQKWAKLEYTKDCKMVEEKKKQVEEKEEPATGNTNGSIQLIHWRKEEKRITRQTADQEFKVKELKVISTKTNY